MNFFVPDYGDPKILKNLMLTHFRGSVAKKNEIGAATLRHCLCFLVKHLIECRITAFDIFMKQDERGIFTTNDSSPAKHEERTYGIPEQASIAAITRILVLFD